jgi:hypothetical protein
MFNNQMSRGWQPLQLPRWRTWWKRTSEGHLYLSDHADNMLVIVLLKEEERGELLHVQTGLSTTRIEVRGPNDPLFVIERQPNTLHLLTLQKTQQQFSLQPGASKIFDRQARDLNALRDLLEPGQQAAFDDWLKNALPAR